MLNRLKMGCFLLGMMLVSTLWAQADSGETKLTFTHGTVPAQFDLSHSGNRWKVTDGQLVNTDESRSDNFVIGIDATSQVTVTADVQILKTHEKGGFWGIALIMKDNTRVQVFNQGHQLRYYVKKSGDKLIPKTFAALPANAYEQASITASIDGDKLMASVNGGKVFELPLETSGIVRVEFQAYQMQVAINSISLAGPFKAAVTKAADAEHLKSQLDVPSDAVQRPTDPNALVIFYIGDSITRHGFNQGTIAKLGWDHLAGMAATEESKDFAHLFGAHVQEANPGKKVSLFFHGKGTGAAAPRLENLGAYVPLKPDIIVVQLGEHEKQPTGPQKLRESYHDLLSTMQQWESKPLILCVGVWNPSGKGERTAYTEWTLQVDQIMGRVCQELKIPYASMEKHALDPACSGWGTSGGVKWHPNDAGMQAYADELIAMYKAAHKP